MRHFEKHFLPLHSSIAGDKNHSYIWSMGLLIGIPVLKFEKDQWKEFTPMKFCGMIFKVRKKNIHC